MKPTYTIGITGGSGSGKTHFINSLASRFTSDEMCFISQDHYYKTWDQQVVDEQGVMNFDLPGSIDREKFHEDILLLKQGETLVKKEYTFNNPASEAKMLEFKPAPILVIEGLFVQYYPEIEALLDLKIFIEAKDYLKLARRIRRDNEERGYDMNDVLYRYQHHIMPVYESTIKPLKHAADFVIPNNQHHERALEVVVSALKYRLQQG